jgi:hypothetical protein
MLNIDSTVLVFWILTTILEVAALAGMVASKSFKKMPYFCGYIGFAVLQSPALGIILQVSWKAYFYSYWASEFINVLLSFFVIREVMEQLLAGRPYWKAMTARIFQWAMAALVLIAAASSASAMSSDSAQITNTVLALERALRFTQCGLLLLVLCFSKILHLSWKHQVVGVVVGMATIAASTLAITAARLQFGRIADQQILLLKPAGYLIAAAVWAGYAWSTHPAVVSKISHLDLDTMRRWRQALAEVELP